MIKVLNLMSTEFEHLKIPYSFDNWEDEVELPYFVGEINEIPTDDEDGKREFEFTLTGEDVNSTERLLEYGELIRARYKNGLIVPIDGAVVAIMYSSMQPIPVEDEGIKRIQINITIYSWEDN